MLALLAMSFPGLAQAQEATEPVYESELPAVPNKETKPKPNSGGGDRDGGNEEGKAGKSNDPTGAGSGSGPNSGGGANNGQTSQGQNGDGAQAGNGSKTAGDVSGGKPLPVEASPASSTSDDGSSSPLVPILIAIVVLAAISIGAFYYRQRRQGDSGSPVSPPKAS
jgi:cobalamin biosynthesis Mg chelatase CobN